MKKRCHTMKKRRRNGPTTPYVSKFSKCSNPRLGSTLMKTLVFQCPIWNAIATVWSPQIQTTTSIHACIVPSTPPMNWCPLLGPRCHYILPICICGNGRCRHSRGCVLAKHLVQGTDYPTRIGRMTSLGRQVHKCFLPLGLMTPMIPMPMGFMIPMPLGFMIPMPLGFMILIPSSHGFDVRYASSRLLGISADTLKYCCPIMKYDCTFWS